MKRFTDTEKWFDPWFRKLPLKFKTFWSYICDRCDNAGVWKPDVELASILIGEVQLTEQEILTVFNGRIEVLKNGSWWIKKFIPFQFGELKPECRPHQAVALLLEQHGIEYQYPIDTLQDKDKDKDKDKEGGVGETKKQALEIYKAYPLKVGKPAALKSIQRAIQRGMTFECLLEKTKAFALARNGDKSFCPNPSTWFNQERYNDDPETWKPREQNGKPKTKTLKEKIAEESSEEAQRYKDQQQRMLQNYSDECLRNNYEPDKIPDIYNEQL